MAEEWNKAEKAIKIAENIDGEVVIPAVFELRYAGRRLVEAHKIKSTDPEGSLALLRDAKFFCHRARHDAIDAATSKMTGDLHAAVDYLSASVIMRNFSDFSEFYASLLEVRQRIAVSRENREERDLIYDTIQNVDLDRLSLIYGRFKACEPLMIIAAEKEESEATENKRLAVQGVQLGHRGIWIGVIGTALGIVLSVLGLYL